MRCQWIQEADEVREVSGSEALWARVWRGNVMVEGELPSIALGDRVIAWSGWRMADADPARGIFPRDASLWMPSTWSQGIQALRALEARAAAAGASILIRPHARHLVSDVPACQRLVATRELRGVGILLDIPGMFTPSMLTHQADHLRRFAWYIANEPRVRGVLFAGTRPSEHDPEQLVMGPLGDRPVWEAVVEACRARIAAESAFAMVTLPGDAVHDIHLPAGGRPIR